MVGSQIYLLYLQNGYMENVIHFTINLEISNKDDKEGGGRGE
jgi:hypothetical protein